MGGRTRANRSTWVIAGLTLGLVGSGAACLLPSLTELSGGSDAGTAGDSGGDVVVTADAGDASTTDANLEPGCDPGKPFAAPTLVPNLNLAGYSSGCARLSPDQLTAVFDAEWPGGAGKADLFITTRPTATSAFTTPTRLTTLNSLSHDWDSSLTTDGLTIYFGSQRVTPENVFSSTRPSVNDPFPAPVAVPGINNADAGAHEAYVLGNSRAIYFGSKRAGGVGANDIYRADGNGTAFGAPVIVPNVNSTSDEQLPTVTDSELLMMLGSGRSGGAGGVDIYLSRRVSTSVSFDVPINVTELNSAFDDYVCWVSEDGCHVLMISDRADNGMHMQLYEARRPK